MNTPAPAHGRHRGGASPVGTPPPRRWHDHPGPSPRGGDAAPTFDDVHARIARIPRVPIAIRPTPMIEAPNLARALGGPRIFVKRDDLTGVALGGNKLRNLEFRLARTMAERPDVVLVGLDLQSNSARQTVGACNRLGLRTVLVLEGARPREVQGNLLVDYLLGAEIHFAADRAEQRRTLDRLAEECRQRGERPHILNDNPMFDVASAIAYLETTMEMIEQLRTAGTAPTVLYMSSSGKGQAGLELARSLWGGFRVHGVTATREYDVAGPHGRHRQRDGGHARPRRARASRGCRELRRLRRRRLRPAERGGQGGRPAVRAHGGTRPRSRLHGQVRGGPDRACPRRTPHAGRHGGLRPHRGAPAIFTWSHLWTEGDGAVDGRP